MTLSPFRARSLSASALLAGAVVALGQAPFELWPLTFVGFAAIALAATQADSPRSVAAQLLAAGFGYFAVALHWIVEPFFVDAARHGWMAPFALVLMAGGMALFWAGAGWLAARLCQPGGARIWALAGGLTLAEVLRATVFTGFPWAHPGHALIASDWLALSPFLGAHGLTALVLFNAAGAAHLATRYGVGWGALPLLAVIGPGFAPLLPPSPQITGDAPVVRLVQPNAPQHLKWRPDMIPIFFDRGLDLTAAPPDPSLGPPDLVIWPETSLPDILGRSDVVRAEISDAAGAAVVLVGAQRYEGIRPRNALAVLDDEGRILAVYDKHHLVPFGEYVPFAETMAGMGVFGLAAAPGGYQAGQGPVVLDLPGALGRAFPMICYEAIFPSYIRAVPRPDWMAHLTNDAWFGSFSGPYQHLALARLRAAEQGLPVLRAANTGISAVIDARGRVAAQLRLNEAGHLDARLPGALPPTVYARLGDAPALFFVLLVTGGACGLGRRHAPLRRAD